MKENLCTEHHQNHLQSIVTLLNDENQLCPITSRTFLNFVLHLSALNRKKMCAEVSHHVLHGRSNIRRGKYDSYSSHNVNSYGEIVKARAGGTGARMVQQCDGQEWPSDAGCYQPFQRL